MADLTIHEYSTASNSYLVATQLNLGSTNLANLNTAIYPVVVGSNTYEKYIKLHFSGAITNVSEIKFWKSTGSYVTGEVLNYTGQVTSWISPTTTTSIYATSTIPTSEPSSANVSIGGSLTGSLTAEGDSDFIVLQGSYSVNASAGDTNIKTFSFSWTGN